MTDTNANSYSDTLRKWQCGAAVVAVVGVPLCALAAVTSLEQFLRSYLVGFLFWWAVTLGFLGILMLYYLVGGRWGVAIKPLLECGTATVPLIAALFLPVAFGIQYLYPWASASYDDAPPRQIETRSISEETSEGRSITRSETRREFRRFAHPNVLVTFATPTSDPKSLYLNPTFFYGRAVGFFVVWLLLAFSFRPRQSNVPADRPRWRRLLSAGGLVALILTVTFAAIDWAMSLDPQWYSTIYGTLVAIGGALAALALVTLSLAALGWCGRSMSTTNLRQSLGDLGSLMLAFLMLWAYFAFSQFLIIWSGNLPEENIWYVNRLQGGWQWMGLAIVALQFFVPFFALLSRELKQRPRSLAAIAALVFVMQFFYFVWTLIPSFHPRQFLIDWADVVVPVALGGLWASMFIGFLRRHVPQIVAMNQ
ncbi:MAG: hypothetical protein R3E01_02255 [Pirellulaceae bacterium]